MEHQPLTIPIYQLIRDSQQMVWILKGNSLIAVPFSNNVKPACRDAGIYDEKKGTPFYLGIKDQNLCLYCTEIRGQPTLQLKEKDIMNLYFEAKGSHPFSFSTSRRGPPSSFSHSPALDGSYLPPPRWDSLSLSPSRGAKPKARTSI